MPAEISKRLGSNNFIIIVPDGYSGKNDTNAMSHIADLGREVGTQLNCYALINSKYKKALADFDDVRALRKRKKLTDEFLLQLKQFKDEISGNDILPQIVVLKNSTKINGKQTDILLGFGQGKRGSSETPPRTTMPGSTLAKVRLALEDQDLTTDIADIGSPSSGNATHCLNQLFRQQNYLEDFYDPAVHSIQINLNPALTTNKETALETARKLTASFKPFVQTMSLVRKIATDTVDTVKEEDLRYIFRITQDRLHNDLMRETYIEELAASIAKNGLLHPLVLLQKEDGRYKILCGFRRFQAIKRLQWPWLEAKVYHEDDFTTEDFFNISLAENTKRRNLNPVEIGNFLESAAKEMELNNTLLAERFGQTLGIGAPGQNVSQSTVHKYRKINQIREQGTSPEMIADVINDKLQFSIAAEILAPIKKAEDRNALYLQIVKPLSPTRPQLLQIMKLLEEYGPSLSDAVTSEEVTQAISKAELNEQKASTFLHSLKDKNGAYHEQQKTAQNNNIASIRKQYFGAKANTRDFNITFPKKPDKEEATLHIRLKKSNTKATLKALQSLLGDASLLDAITSRKKG